jgi:hypothetical protein
MADYTWLYHPIPRGPQRLPSCCICNDAVPLETSNTDEYGQAVHEECYVLKVCLKAEFLNDGESISGPANRHSFYQPCAATMAENWESPMPRQPAVLAAMRMQRAKRIPWFNRPWRVDMAAVVTVLAVTCWIAFSDRYPASFLGPSGQQRSIAIEEQVPLPPEKAMPAKDRFMLQDLPGSVEGARTATRLQKVGVEENEVVHIGEDVTVHYFTPKPAPHRVPAGQYQVVYIGEDVTVRYFTPISRHSKN